MKTGCIIVLYNPNWELLKKVMSRVTLQVNHVFISDNSSSNNKDKFQNLPNTTYQSNGKNLGIATAQNNGILFFEDKNYDFVFFLDQDSIPPQNMVAILHEQFQYLQQQNIKMGGVCARTVNRENHKKEIARIKKGKKITHTITEVDQMISSSSLIPIKNFKKVGYLEDALFIDGVDHEWCWRAKAKENLRFFIIENTLLSHKRGEGDTHFLFFRIAISSPFRVYYQYRNYLRLVRRSYVPLYWKTVNFFKYLVKYFYFSTCSSNRKSYFRRMNNGIRAGITSKNEHG